MSLINRMYDAYTNGIQHQEVDALAERTYCKLCDNQDWEAAAVMLIVRPFIAEERAKIPDPKGPLENLAYGFGYYLSL